MPFYKRTDGSGDFVIHWDRQPLRAFGAFAKGYARAAKQLAEDLLSQQSFPDYAAYPVVFLYRHAVELHLKRIIVEGTRLDQLTNPGVATEKLQCIHELSQLFRGASKVLCVSFPEDHSLKTTLNRLQVVLEQLDGIDRSSFAFRYPVDRTGASPVSHPLHLNLRDVAETMERVLGDLEAIQFGIDVATSRVEEILDILSRVDTEGLPN